MKVNLARGGICNLERGGRSEKKMYDWEHGVGLGRGGRSAKSK